MSRMPTPFTPAEETLWLAQRMQVNRGQAIVLSNKTQPAVDQNQLLAALDGRLPEGQIEVVQLRTTIEAIDGIGLVLKPERRADFLAGHPVLIAPMVIPLLPPRERGRPVVTDLEARARDAFYVTVTLATERLRACADARDGSTWSREARRLAVFEDLATAVELPREEADAGADEQEQRLRFLDNSFREGQARLKLFYPGRRARDVLQEAYDGVRAVERASERAAIAARELRRVEILSRVHRRAQVVRTAQHDVSGMLRAGQPMGRAQQQKLAHALEGGLKLDALMEAALLGDINPAPLFAYVATWVVDLEVGRRLGRLARGAAVVLEPAHGAALGRLFVMADQEGDDADLRAARLVRDAALALRPVSFWDALRVVLKTSGSPCHLGPRQP